MTIDPTVYIYDLIIGFGFVTKSLTCNGTIAQKLTTHLPAAQSIEEPSEHQKNSNVMLCMFGIGA